MPVKSVVFVSFLAVLVVGTALPLVLPAKSATERPTSAEVMLILRGVATSENPRGALDDEAALEYARRAGFQGEVLDVPGYNSAESPQVRLALDRIRSDRSVTAIYGFSAGGYNARLIWEELNGAERARILKVIVIGAPGIAETDFNGSHDVVIMLDPPAGHMAGPRTLLESLWAHDLEATELHTRGP